MFARSCLIICTITYTNVSEVTQRPVVNDRRYISDYSSKSCFSPPPPDTPLFFSGWRRVDGKLLHSPGFILSLDKFTDYLLKVSWGQNCWTGHKTDQSASQDLRALDQAWFCKTKSSRARITDTNTTDTHTSSNVMKTVTNNVWQNKNSWRK